MITHEKEKEEQLKLNSTNQNNTDASNNTLIVLEQKSYIKQLNKPNKTKKAFQTLIPGQNKLSLTSPSLLQERTQTIIHLSPNFRPSLIKSFKEDEDNNKDNKQFETVINNDNTENYNLKSTITESNEYDNDNKKGISVAENIIDQDYRHLYKKERICDDDTEDSASDIQNIKKWIILPDCLFKKIWNGCVSLAIFYSAVVTPYGIAFNDHNDIQPFEYFIDSILLIDIIINFFSAYSDDQDNLIKSHKKIILGYLKSWFIPDIIAIFPFTAIISNSKFNRINKITRLTKLPKFYRLLRLTKLIRITRISKKGNISSITKVIFEKLKLNSNIEKLMYFLLTFLLLSHLSTCIWYFVAKMEDLSPDSWVVRLGYIDSTNFQIYILSFYWTLTTVTTVGYGDISAGTTPERIYNLFIMSFGVLMYSFAIGSLSSIVSALDQKNAEMNQKLEILSSIKNEYHLEPIIYDKVRKVIKFDLSRNQKDKNQFLEELPNKLRIELSQIMHDKIVQNFNFFRDQPNDFFPYVAPLLKPVKFSQNEFLYKCQDMIDEMYFISKGTIIFCLEKKYAEKEIKEIKKSNNFGEIEMCLNEPLRYHIKVKSRSCELFILKKNDFLRLSVNFKEFIENFLHQSLMIYLKYNEERKRIIDEYDRITNKINRNQSVNSVDSISHYKNNHITTYDEGTNSKSEEEGNSKAEDEVNDSDKSKTDFSICDSEETENNINQTNSGEFHKKKHKALDDTKHNMKKISSRNSLKSDNYQRKKLFSDNNIYYIFNIKFQKKIDSILAYLKENNVTFPDNADNPKKLLEQLKNVTNIEKREEIVNKMEGILKQIYNE